MDTTEEADWVVTDEVMNAAVGLELRVAREDVGLTRAELAEELPFAVKVATLANYEQGKRSISFRRLVEFCRVVHVTAPDLLRRAIERVEAIQSLLVELDIRAVADDDGDDPQFALLRLWARNRMAVAPRGKTTVRLHHSVVRELAVLLDIPTSALVEHLEASASLRTVSGPTSTSQRCLFREGDESQWTQRNERTANGDAVDGAPNAVDPIP